VTHRLKLPPAPLGRGPARQVCARPQGPERL
jgi:hypothetical protein